MDQNVMVWIDQVCQEAKDDVGLANDLSRKSRALAHYFINVVKTGAYDASHWASHYPNMYMEAERAYAEYQLLNEAHTTAQASAAKVNTLEEKLTHIEAMLEALLTVQTPKQQAKVADVLATEATTPAPAAETTPEPDAPAAEAEGEPAKDS